jgi:hypothetical protein
LVLRKSCCHIKMRASNVEEMTWNMTCADFNLY